MTQPNALPEVVFPGGESRPALGLGTWRLGESAARRGAETKALRLALDLGWRVFDSAEMYGEGGAESVLGDALAGAMRQGLAREALFVVSKVYPHHASRAGVVAACERSLRRLKLDSIDLYLLHWRGAEPLAETLAGFAELQRRGWIRRWGVSNFDLDDMEELFALDGGAACSANQVCYGLGARGVEFDLLPWHQARGLPLMAYSPLDQGALVGPGAAASLRAV
ncbi:MAG: aldo/keto reductase, partial [Burkholderiales bacterium]|nr:aldo/keto reductase [Burkholderiales bacterium]